MSQDISQDVGHQHAVPALVIVKQHTEQFLVLSERVLTQNKFVDSVDDVSGS